MKLLFDANISRKIVPLLDDLFPKSTHTTLAGLAGETSDETVWEFARDHSFAIVTADKDFVRLAEVNGPPPQVVRLEKMDYSTEVAADLIRRYAVAINDFGKGAKALLVLRRTYGFLETRKVPIRFAAATLSGFSLSGRSGTLHVRLSYERSSGGLGLRELGSGFAE